MPSAVVSRWPPAAVESLERSLEELAGLVGEVSRKGDSDREVAWLARLLVIRSCGYLEQVVAEVASGLTEQKSGGVIRTFALTWIGTGNNPTPDRLLKWVQRFNQEWATELEEILDAEDERLGRELSLLVDRRNRVAHGLNEGITVRKALDLKETACTLADWFVLRFNPQR